MPTIKSKIPVPYFSRTLQSGIVYVELQEWVQKETQYAAKIVDYVMRPLTIQNEFGEDVEILERQDLIAKELYFPLAQVDGIHDAIGDQLGDIEGYCDRQKALVSIALLYYVQTDLVDDNGNTIYGITPDQWELHE